MPPRLTIAIPTLNRTGLLGRILGRFPSKQFVRYLVLGAINTAFGYGTFAGLTAILTPHIPFAYMFAYGVAYFLNVTFSFITYKHFIFKTKGKYLREWSRCIVVYSGAAFVGTILLAPTVYAIRFFTEAEKAAPYIAGAIVSSVTVISSFFGHKNYTFTADDGSEKT